MSSLQERLAAITAMQLGAIAAVVHLKSQLSGLEDLRERVMNSTGNCRARNERALPRDSGSKLESG